MTKLDNKESNYRLVKLMKTLHNDSDLAVRTQLGESLKLTASLNANYSFIMDF